MQNNYSTCIKAPLLGEILQLNYFLVYVCVYIFFLSIWHCTNLFEGTDQSVCPHLFHLYGIEMPKLRKACFTSAC